MGRIKKDSRRLFRVVLCSQAAILYSKCQFFSDSSRVHSSIPDPAARISTIMDQGEGQI